MNERARPEAGPIVDAQGGSFRRAVSVALRVRPPRWVINIAILMIAVVLRLWQVNAIGFNSDEAVYSGQGASIAGDAALRSIFPIFRAHPLLFQFQVSVVYRMFGVTDGAARLLAVALGVATVTLVYRLGRELYGRTVGSLSALILAVMPYHVIVTRQALLDGPMVFFATLTFYLLARLASTGRIWWFYASGAAMGLTFLSKETSIVLFPAIYVFLALTPSIAVRLRDVGASFLIFLLIVAPYPVSLKLGGGSGTAQNFLVWQIFRPTNHPWTFYLLTVPRALGLLTVFAAAAGLWFLRWERGWREILLLSWIVVPVTFFQLWPVKGYQYLLPVAPPIAVLAARFVTRIGSLGRVLRLKRSGSVVRAIAATALVASLAMSSLPASGSDAPQSFLAGSGGVPGGREAGTWVLNHVPRGATLLTIGPSMGNILQFYGHRSTLGLSVSPNPLHRNPVYDPVRNPDLELRTGNIQYVVWDAFSASRSTYFTQQLLRYVRRYRGIVAYTGFVSVPTTDGERTPQPVIVIYQVTA